MTQVAYKFLDAERRAPYTGVAWTPGEWVEAASASQCREGVHGCRAADVSYWLAHALWRVELDGDVVDTRHKAVGSRGRLLEEVAGYDVAMHELREQSAWRCRDRAAAALRAAGDAELAAAFEAAGSLDELASLGARCDESTFAGRAGALAADCAHFAVNGVHAQAPFVAACSAGHVAAGPQGDQSAFDAGYEAERRFQSGWLTDRLGL